MLDLFYSVWIPMTSYKYRSSEKSVFQIGKLGYGKWRRSKNWFSVIGVFLSALQAIIIAWKCLWKETCSSPYIQCWSQNIQALWKESQLILLLPVEMEDWISFTFLLIWGFPGGSDGKESACNAGDQDSIPAPGRSPGEGNGYPLPYSCLENFIDRDA